MVPLQNFPLLNPATIDMLKKNTRNDPEFLTELFESFIEDSRELFDELYRTAEANLHTEYFESVHTFKGLCGTIGCSRMFELLKVMDLLNKQNDFSQSTRHLPELMDVFNETREEINKEILQ
jgi:HPt (histidine-containing phosphotransfer) domain-containing protein